MSLRRYHASVFGCALLLWVASASAQPTTPQQTPRPVAPDWTPIAAGWDVYMKKGCAQCHGIRSSKAHAAPDLARIQSGAGFYELGAAMWNHRR